MTGTTITQLVQSLMTSSVPAEVGRVASVVVLDLLGKKSAAEIFADALAAAEREFKTALPPDAQAALSDQIKALAALHDHFGR